MRSKWFGLKGRAIRLRKKGCSIRDIERRLGIPKSTLSGWLKSIQMDDRKRKRLLENWHLALTKARKKAVLWHKKQKEQRLNEARQQALNKLKSIDIRDSSVQELALAILYMGEGRKRADMTSLGSSDPLILKFFLSGLRNLYNIDLARVRCTLYLRADQDSEKLRRFWAKELSLPMEIFTRVYKDQRTVGSKTYSHYRGVCAVDYGDVAIKRKLLFLSQMFCARVVKEYLGA